MEIYKKKYVADKISKRCRKQNAKKYIIKNYDELIKKDKIYKVLRSLVRRSNFEFTKLGVDNPSSHLELIGCSIEKLKEHISNKFTNGMTFNNYAEWEIDHIMPVSSFDLTNDDEIRKCFNYTNLQPLWKHDNRTKSDKIEN